MMGRGVTASSQCCSVCWPPRAPSRIHQPRFSVGPRASRDHPFFASNLKLISSGSRNFPRITFRCNSTGDSGENESRTVLDAFFLGKALAEAVNERLESAVGEFLSAIGRVQAEQQKQVQEFQEEVLEKARWAKEQAAREAMEARGLIPRTPAADEASSTVNGVATTTSPASDSASSSESKPSEDHANMD